MKTYLFINLVLVFLLFNSFLFAQYPNTAVTTNPNDQSETAIAVSPLNSMYMIGSWNDYRFGQGMPSGVGLGVSTDGGTTWRIIDTINANKEELGLLNYQYGCNTSVAFDRYGNAYCCWVAMEDYDNSAIVIAKSSDMGVNWNYTKVSPHILGQDKPWITIDNSGGANDGRIYVSWTEVIRGATITTYNILTSYSSDHGTTFSTPHQFEALTTSSSQPIMRLTPEYARISYPTADRILQCSMPTVGPNGEVYVIWVYSYVSTTQYKLSKSTDGGVSWSAQISGPPLVSFVWQYVGNARILPLPSLAVAQNGNLYLAYTDYKASGDHNCRVKFSYSTNSGTTWNTSIVGEATGWQYFATLSINQTGRLSLGFMHSPNPLDYQPSQETWLSTSDNFGVSWSSEKINNNYSYPFMDLSIHATYEYMGIASRTENNQAYMLWTHHNTTNSDPYYISVMDKSADFTMNYNLCSLPVDVNNHLVDYLHPERIAGAWGYEGTYVYEWVMLGGTGYWIKYLEPITIPYRGVPIYKRIIPVTAGWNMIGSLSVDLPVSKIILDNTSYDSKYFGYTAVGPTPGYFETNVLSAGKGYWIKVTQNGNLILDYFSIANTSCSQQTVLPPPPPDPPLPSTISGITVLVNGVRYPLLSWRRCEYTTYYKLYSYLCAGTFDCFDGMPKSVIYQGTDTSFIDYSMPVGGKYAANRAYYYVTACNNYGESVISNKQIYNTDLGFVLKTHDRGNNENASAIPVYTQLQENYPNPFNPQTTIYYDLSEDRRVRLSVMNILGEEIKVLIDEDQNAGYKSVTFDGSNLSSGIYFYKLTAGRFNDVRKMVILK